ncbi:GlsB/YeaQ/YmgE family stress response membrane protein, partial [Escherichia coli]|nr:GlsB/YeaQ/YmgE family stress response membrane protein [Escherichia coli]
LGWILTALLGIGGAFIGGLIARTLWAGENYTAGWIMSILGAIILLLIVRLLFGKGGNAA